MINYQKMQKIDIDKLLKDNGCGVEAGKTAFRTPEGYFDSLNDRIMSGIPEKKARIIPITFKSHRIVRWAAACACVVVIGVATLVNVFPDTLAINSASEADDAMIEAAEYAMFDNQDMYYLIADDQL